MPKFSLREILMLLTIFALAFGWNKERKDLHEKVLEYQIRHTMSAGNWERRRETAKQLSIEPRKNIDKLLYMLSDPDRVTREIAEKALGSVDSIDFLSQNDELEFKSLLNVYSEQAGVNHD